MTQWSELRWQQQSGCCSLYLNDVDVSMAVAASEDGVDGRGDAQSVCDTLWTADRATDRVHWPEQLAWNTHVATYSGYPETQTLRLRQSFYLDGYLHVIDGKNTRWNWPLNISMVPLLRAVSPLMGESLQRLMSAKRPAHKQTQTF